MRLVRWLTGVN